MQTGGPQLPPPSYCVAPLVIRCGPIKMRKGSGGGISRPIMLELYTVKLRLEAGPQVDAGPRIEAGGLIHLYRSRAPVTSGVPHVSRGVFSV